MIRSRVRIRKRTIACSVLGSLLSGEKTGVTKVPAIGERVSFAPSVIANATAVAASRARTTTLGMTRATRR